MKKLTCCKEFEYFLLEHNANLIINYRKDDDEKVYTSPATPTLINPLMGAIMRRDENLREALMRSNKAVTTSLINDENTPITNLSISYVNGGQLIGDKYRVNISFDLDLTTIGQYVEGDNVVIESFLLMLTKVNFSAFKPAQNIYTASDETVQKDAFTYMPIKVPVDSHYIKRNGAINPFFENIILSFSVDDFVKHNPSIPFSTIMKMKALCLGREASEDLIQAYYDTNDVTILPNCSEAFDEVVSNMIADAYEW